MPGLACSRAGAGPPFVWAHGLTSSRADEDERGLLDWEPVVAAGRELVRYDARGHGASSGPREAAAFEWTQLAVDLLALVDDLEFDRVSAGGASMGCATVLHAAVRAPARFDRLVLVSPPTAWESRPEQAARYELVAALVEKRGKDAFTRAVRAIPPPPIFAGEPDHSVADITEELFPFVFRGAASSDLPAPDDVRCIGQPALVLAWDTDPGHPVATAERLAELLPDARLHVAASVEDIRAWPALAADFLS